MEFSAKTNTSDEWKAIISAISTLVEEATFEATVEGVSFRGMDPSHVALIDISWPNSAFEKYSCDGDIKFGVRIDEFSKLIKRAEKSDGIEINISDDKMLHLSIVKNKKYKMRLIESSASDTPLPKISYDSKIALSSSRLDKILGDIEVVSDYLSIKTTEFFFLSNLCKTRKCLLRGHILAPLEGLSAPELPGVNPRGQHRESGGDSKAI